MRKMTVAFMCATAIAASVFGAYAFDRGAAAEEDPPLAQTETRIEVAEELTWTSNTTNAGWSHNGDLTPRKNKTMYDAAITVNGVTYDRNSLCTHLSPDASVNVDIEYDISEYTDEFNYFDVYIAQPDVNAANWPKFTVLVDGVAQDCGYYRTGGDYAKAPLLLRAYVAGASTLTLRANHNDKISVGWGNGECLWLDPVLYKVDQSERTYASDLKHIMTSNDMGWDFGYTARPMLDTRADNSPIVYSGYEGGVAYSKGIGVHIKGAAYADYEADKTDTSKYVSLKWNIKDKGFDYFNAAAYMYAGYGVHVEVFIDGEEVYKSGKITSISTYWHEQLSAIGAGKTINVAIPNNAEMFEVRFIADTVMADGQVELCDAAFYKSNEYLYTRYAEETLPDIYPIAVVRGKQYDGSTPKLHVGNTQTDEIAEKALYGLSGTAYEFDIAGENYNYFSSTVGTTDRFDSGKVEFNADVIYADGTKKTVSSGEITYADSGVPFEFRYDNTDAVKLKLYITGESAFSDCVFVEPKLSVDDRLVFTFVDGETEREVYVASGELLTPVTLPDRIGYTLEGWKDESGELFDFQTPVTEDMRFTPVWSANKYDVVFETLLNGEPSGAAEYEAIKHTYGVDTELPAVKQIAGYDFKGFYLADDRLTAIGANVLTDNARIIAKYEKKLYHVTFKNGIDELINDVYFGDVAIKPADPVKEGHTFKGWFSDESGTSAYDFTAPVSKDTTIYAVFEKNSTPSEPDDPDDQNKPGKDDPDKSGDGDNTGLIVGLSVGGVALVIAAVAAALIIRKKKRTAKTENNGDKE